MQNELLIKNARTADSGELVDISVFGGIIEQIRTAGAGKNKTSDQTQTIDAGGKYISPGFVDLHVHLRDPGQTHKEDIASGTMAAAAGGITTVCCMPNTRPCLDTPELVRYVLGQRAYCNVLPVGAITKSQKGEELTDFAALKKAGAIALSDDGRPVESDELMRAALLKAKENDMLVMPHCEDLGLSGNASEDKITKRDIELAQKVGARLHICHVSTKKSAEYVAQAKRAGARISAETCPHYFALTEKAVLQYGENARMNPPLRSEEDREGIIEAIKSGAIETISTDHAPHSEEEKKAGQNGITGLESAFALGVTYLVRPGHITLAKLIEMMTINPARIIGVEGERGKIEEGKAADFVIFDPEEKFTFDKTKSRSKSRNTPFHGFELYGKVLWTVVNGNVAYSG
ncbi:MAG: dihydroorotase [Oscillospiraceae bacterium]|nr:dihydroorotase [Oscillospiraceae bacterium]